MKNEYLLEASDSKRHWGIASSCWMVNQSPVLALGPQCPTFGSVHRLTTPWAWITFNSVEFSCWVVSDSLWPYELQHSRPPCPSPIHGVHPNSCPLRWWCHPTIFSSVVLFSSNPSQHQGLFKWVSSSHQVAKVLEFHLQHQSFQWTLRTDLLQNGLVGSPCSPRDSQESSPTPQFKSINSSVLSFLYSPTLTSMHDHWKNNSLD